MKNIMETYLGQEFRYDEAEVLSAAADKLLEPAPCGKETCDGCLDCMGLDR